MTTPHVTEIRSSRLPASGANEALYARLLRRGAREMYFAPDDLYVLYTGTDSKSRATIIHPMRGACTVPAADLRSR
jgi:hypothetical protein